MARVLFLVLLTVIGSAVDARLFAVRRVGQSLVAGVQSFVKLDADNLLSNAPQKHVSPPPPGVPSIGGAQIDFPVSTFACRLNKTEHDKKKARTSFANLAQHWGSEDNFVRVVMVDTNGLDPRRAIRVQWSQRSRSSERNGGRYCVRSDGDVDDSGRDSRVSPCCSTHCRSGCTYCSRTHRGRCPCSLRVQPVCFLCAGGRFPGSCPTCNRLCC